MKNKGDIYAYVLTRSNENAEEIRDGIHQTLFLDLISKIKADFKPW